jgi:hypothetical protein
VRGQGTPLCPAGHLPLKGGDWLYGPSALLPNGVGVDGAPAEGQGLNDGLISPLEGEMSGRTEGGERRRPMRGAYR